MIRWMGGLGQSSDPSLPSYHPDGLPLIAGEVERLASLSLVDTAWESPEALPTLMEIRDPEAWIRRVG